MNSDVRFSGFDEKKQDHIVFQTYNFDSDHRDDTVNTTHSEYKHYITQIRNVVGIKLISTEIPNTQFVINSSNNVIQFIHSAYSLVTVYDGLVPHGNYTGTELATALDLAMNTALGVGAGISLTASYSTITKKMTITPIGGNLTLLFGTGDSKDISLYKILGFGENVDIGPTGSAILSDNIVDVSGDDYILMQITNPHMVTNVRSLGGQKNAFAKLINEAPPGFINYSNFVSPELIFDKPFTSINSLDFKFTNSEGVLVDFNGRKHSFSIIFASTTIKY